MSKWNWNLTPFAIFLFLLTKTSEYFFFFALGIYTYSILTNTSFITKENSNRNSDYLKIERKSRIKFVWPSSIFILSFLRSFSGFSIFVAFETAIVVTRLYRIIPLPIYLPNDVMQWKTELFCFAKIKFVWRVVLVPFYDVIIAFF